MALEHPYPVESRVMWSDAEGMYTGIVEGWDQDLDVYIIRPDRPANTPLALPVARTVRVATRWVRYTPASGNMV